jgi:hypothetical protein
MNGEQEAAAGSSRRKFVLNEAADMRRLAFHLLTHWPLPRVEVGMEKLPPLVVQRAQTRFLRITQASESQILGLLAAGATVLIGSFHLVWNWSRDWHALVLVGTIALYAGLIGTVVSVCFSRLRLLLATSWFLLKTRRLRNTG